MSLPELLAGAERSPGKLAADLPEGWMQGRTAYGGLSAALAHEAARSSAEELPPLRSLHAAFVGPLSGRLEAKAEVLRRGKSTAFVQADVSDEQGLGLRAILVFSAPRGSALDYEDLPAPAVPSPEEAEPALRKAVSKYFTNNFEYRHALSIAGRRDPEFLRWARLKDREGLDPVTELLACGDALPPAAMGLMPEPKPVSSINWTLNLLGAPRSRDGWWLLQAKAQGVAHGGSSQSMAIWNADLKPVAAAMQSIAIFA